MCRKCTLLQDLSCTGDIQVTHKLIQAEADHSYVH